MRMCQQPNCLSPLPRPSPHPYNSVRWNPRLQKWWLLPALRGLPAPPHLYLHPHPPLRPRLSLRPRFPYLFRSARCLPYRRKPSRTKPLLRQASWKSLFSSYPSPPFLLRTCNSLLLFMYLSYSVKGMRKIVGIVLFCLLLFGWQICFEQNCTDRIFLFAPIYKQSTIRTVYHLKSLVNITNPQTDSLFFGGLNVL